MVEEPLFFSTQIVLIITTLLIIYLLVRKRYRGERIRGDFSVLLLILVLAWLPLELVEDLDLKGAQLMTSTAHLAVMFVIAISLTLRWRNAMSRAREQAGE